MLVHRQWNQFQCSSSHLDDQKLASKNTYHNQDEQVIITNFLENIHFILFQLPCIEKVKHLQKYKCIEEYTQVSSSFWIPLINFQSQRAWNSEKFGHKQDDWKNTHLENCMQNDISPHERCNDVLGSWVWHSQEQFFWWRLSSEGQCSQCIHDKINPKHLNWSQWGLFN